MTALSLRTSGEIFRRAHTKGLVLLNARASAIEQ